MKIKKDVVKEFELVVRQEIINNERSIAQNSQFVIDFRDEINKKLSSIEPSLLKNQESIQLLKTSYEVILKAIDSLSSKLEQIKERIDVSEKKSIEDRKNIEASIKDLYLNDEKLVSSDASNLKKFSDTCNKNYLSQRDKINELKEYVDSVETGIYKLFDYLKNQPCKEDELIKKLQKSIEQLASNYKSDKELIAKLNFDLNYMNHKYDYLIKEIQELKKPK